MQAPIPADPQIADSPSPQSNSTSEHLIPEFNELLPTELQVEVLSKLPWKDIVQHSAVSTEHRELVPLALKHAVRREASVELYRTFCQSKC